MLLLAYLALTGPQARKRLAMLFWPRATEPLNRLSVTLGRIRHAVPGVVHADRYRVWVTLTVDAGAVLDALSSDGSKDLRSLYRGGFLEGVYVPGLSEELQEWIDHMAERLALGVQQALVATGEALAESGDARGAARCAEDAYGLGTTWLGPAELSRLHHLLRAGGSPMAGMVMRDVHASAGSG